MPAIDLQSVTLGTQESHTESLRQLLDYPLKQRDPEGFRFWFLRPSVDEDEAEDTCPNAMGFYFELDGLTDSDIKPFLTALRDRSPRQHQEERGGTRQLER
jgi:hypothetical protein